MLLFAEAASLIRYASASAEPEEGVRWERLQQQATAAPPAAAAPAKSKVPAAAVPVSTAAHSNNLYMPSPLPELRSTTLAEQRLALTVDRVDPRAGLLVLEEMPQRHCRARPARGPRPGARRPRTLSWRLAGWTVPTPRPKGLRHGFGRGRRVGRHSAEFGAEVVRACPLTITAIFLAGRLSVPLTRAAPKLLAWHSNPGSASH